MKKILRESTFRKIPEHGCFLPIEDDPVDLRINQGICVSFRRSLWKWVTVSESNPDSKRFLRSAALIGSEKIRHIDRFPYVVHPFSKARFFWRMLMIPVWLLLFISIPTSIAKLDVPMGMVYGETFLQVICWIDIVLRFFAGYYSTEKQVVILRFRTVAWHYIRSNFIFDVVSCIPVNLFLRLFDHEKKYQYVSTILLIKMTRLPTLIRYIHMFSERTNFLASNIKFCCFILTLALLVAWTTSAIFMIISIIHPAMAFKRMVGNVPIMMTAFRVTRCLMRVGITNNVNTSNALMLCQIVLITMGTILEIIILAKVMQVYHKHTSSRSKYTNLIGEIGEYMNYNELPTRLRVKILKYLDFKFQKNIFRDEDVLNNLSSVLKHDILQYTCQNMVAKVDFFKDLPPNVMMRIVNKLRSEIYLPSDVIVLAGYTGNAMYFIYTGTVAVYTGYGKEICHLEDGSHFGEIALLINEPRVATVVAIKECELFKLTRRDFQESIEPFPKLCKKIRALAMDRLERTLQMMSDDLQEGRSGEELTGVYEL